MRIFRNKQEAYISQRTNAPSLENPPSLYLYLSAWVWHSCHVVPNSCCFRDWRDHRNHLLQFHHLTHVYKIKKRKQRPERGSNLSKVTEQRPAEPNHIQGSQLPGWANLILNLLPGRFRGVTWLRCRPVQELPRVWPSSLVLELLKTTFLTMRLKRWEAWLQILWHSLKGTCLPKQR